MLGFQAVLGVRGDAARVFCLCVDLFRVAVCVPPPLSPSEGEQESELGRASQEPPQGRHLSGVALRPGAGST